MLSMCTLGSGGLVTAGNSVALMLPTLLLDAPERGRLDLVVSRFCFGFLPFPSEDEGASSGGVVDRREPTAVSDLYRGRVGGTVSVALTPAETERDRRRPTVDGVVGDCVVSEGGLGKVMVVSESEDRESWGSES